MGSLVDSDTERRLEQAVASIPYPVKVVVLSPDPGGADAATVLSRVHRLTARQTIVDPALYLGVDVQAGELTALEFDVTTSVARAIPVAAERAPGDPGEQLVVATRLLAAARAEQAYDQRFGDGQATGDTTSEQPGAEPVSEAGPAVVDLPTALIMLAVVAAALSPALWSRRRTRRSGA